MIGRVSDRAIHASVAALLPDVFATTDADWARTTAVQLAALAAHASRRPADPTESAEAELRDVLEAGGDESAVGAGGAVGAAGTGGASGGWDGTDGDDPWERAAEVLRSAVSGGAATDPGGIERRDALRSILVRQLDAELASTSELMDAFRGKPARG